MAERVAGERHWRESRILEAQLTEHRRLELPTDRPRPAVPSYRGAVGGSGLSGELSEQLRRLSRREGATLFMTLMAGFKVLLSGTAERRMSAIGTDIANRNRTG